MAYGFRGDPAETYFTGVYDALSAAKTAHLEQPFREGSGRIVPLPVLPNRPNEEAPHLPGTAHSGGHSTGIRNSSNIVVDYDEYYAISHRINEIDEQAGQRLYDIAREIEDLCQTSFILPRTVPECLLITMGLVNSLGEFRGVTEETRIQIQKFAGAILDIG